MISGRDLARWPLHNDSGAQSYLGDHALTSSRFRCTSSSGAELWRRISETVSALPRQACANACRALSGSHPSRAKSRAPAPTANGNYTELGSSSSLKPNSCAVYPYRRLSDECSIERAQPHLFVLAQIQAVLTDRRNFRARRMLRALLIC